MLTAFSGAIKSHWLYVGCMHIAEPITVTMGMQCFDWVRPRSHASFSDLLPDEWTASFSSHRPATVPLSGFIGPSHIY